MRENQANIVKVAISIIAGTENGRVDRAAAIIGVSSPTLYRWIRAGNLRAARGAELLRVHDLSRIPIELLLGADDFSTREDRITN
jgi:excisionase family DNA binding protein